jgi:hypothetical protein
LVKPIIPGNFSSLVVCISSTFENKSFQSSGSLNIFTEDISLAKNKILLSCAHSFYHKLSGFKSRMLEYDEAEFYAS